MANPGMISIDNKPYRIDVESYRVKDLADFSPRAASPGGSVVMSDLLLYQPLMMTDWRHGFGHVRFDDEMGYLKTDGCVDTRHEGIVMLYTQPVLSEAVSASGVTGYVSWNGYVWQYGVSGLKRYLNGTWKIAYNSEAVNAVLQTKSYLFVCPNGARIKKIDTTAAPLGSELLLNGDIEAGSANTTPTNWNITPTKDAWHKFDRTNLYPFTYPTGQWYVWCYAGGVGGGNASGVTKGYSNNFAATAGKSYHITADIRRDVQVSGTTSVVTYAVEWKNVGGSVISTDTIYTDTNTTEITNPSPIVPTTAAADLTAPATTTQASIVCQVSVTVGDQLHTTRYDFDNMSFKENLTVSISDAGVDANSVGYKWLVIYNGAIYAGVDNSNRIHYDTSEDLSLLEGTTADPNKLLCGGGGIPTIGAIVYGGRLYVSKQDGLWVFTDSDKIFRKVIDYTMEQSSANFPSMFVHNGYLIYAYRNRVIQWNGARFTDITPPKLTDTFPYITYGNFKNFLVVDNYLYCTGRSTDTTYKESLLCFDGTAWHKLADLVTNGIYSVAAVGFDITNSRIWYFLSGVGALSTYYINLQRLSEYPYANFPTTGTHSIISSQLDLGFRRVTKSSPSLFVQAANISMANYYLDIYYSLDGGSWIKWDSIDTSGVTELVSPNSLDSVEYKYMQIRVDFITNDVTQSPVLEEMTLRFLMRPDVFYGYSFNVIAATGATDGMMELTDAKATIDNLRASRDSKAPIDFTDIVGRTTKGYISSLIEQAGEISTNEMGAYTDVEHVITVNFVEAR